MRTVFPLAPLAFLALTNIVACGGGSNGGPSSNGSSTSGGSSGGSTSGGSTSGGSTSGGGSSVSGSTSSGAPYLNNLSAIYNYLVGKTYIETGADIPAFPYGWDANANNNGSPNGGACFNEQTLQFTSLAGDWSLTQTPGTLTGAVVDGSAGTCDTATAGGSPTTPMADTYTLSNLHGSAVCFDIDVSAADESGRGDLSADGKTLTLELYHNSLNPSGHRCADGSVGFTGVMFGSTPFTGNALQVWKQQ
jgi:hypothetical protein